MAKSFPLHIPFLEFFLIFKSFFIRFLGVMFLCIQTACSVLYSQDVQVDIFTKFGNILAITSSNICSVPFSVSPLNLEYNYMHLNARYLSQVPETSFNSLSIIFLSLFLGSIVHFYLADSIALNGKMSIYFALQVRYLLSWWCVQQDAQHKLENNIITMLKNWYFSAWKLQLGS